MNGKTEHEAILFFDGTCGLCNSSVQFVLRHEKNTTLTFAALQSDFGQSKLAALQPLPDSLVLFKHGKFYVESDAALHLCSYMKWYLSWLQIFLLIPRFVRNAIYRWVARNRYTWFGTVEYCSIGELTPERVIR
jgi:predicted DCC family thiol-disulfide oxidoreductase YuxK